MSTLEKKINRLLSIPGDYTYDEAKALLCACGFDEDNKGRTSGSRVRFYRKEDNKKVILHKPHPEKTMHKVVVKQLAEFMESIV